MKVTKVVQRPKYQIDTDISYLSPLQQDILLGRLNKDNIDNFTNIEQITHNTTNLNKVVEIAKYLPDTDKLLEFMNTKYNKDMHICIISDFDTDGITSCVVIEKSLELIKHTGKVSSIVNKRIYGTGVTSYCLEQLEKINKEQQVDLIILSDHGSSNGEEYKLIQEKMIPNVTIILTDHHEVEMDIKNDNFIFINAHRDYKLDNKIKHILQSFSGCAIAYLTMLLMARDNYQDLEPLLYLVGLSTISDVMPLDNPYNRYLVKSGINELYSEWFYIINKIVKNIKVTTKSLSFNVIPSINTGNRTNNEELSYGYVNNDVFSIIELEKINIERKVTTRQVYKELLYHQHEIVHPHTVIAKLNTNLSIAGNVASKLGEHFYKPAIVFNDSNGEITTGSLRGIIPNIDIVQALKEVDKTKGILIKYGGHKQAGGCSLYTNRLEEFKTLFDNAIKQQMDKIDTTKYIYYDRYVDSDDINIGLYKSTEIIGPYGKNWDEPTFITKMVITSIITIGTMCKFIFRTSGKYTLEGIGSYNKEDVIQYVGKPVHIVFTLELKTKNGYNYFSLNVLEILENFSL